MTATQPHDPFCSGCHSKECQQDGHVWTGIRIISIESREESDKLVTSTCEALVAAKEHLEQQEKLKSSMAVLVMGANQCGNMAVHLVKRTFTKCFLDVRICIADSSIEGLIAAQQNCDDIICWLDDEHEESLVEKMTITCRGRLDIVIDFIGTTRTIQRAFKILKEGGVLLIGNGQVPEVITNMHAIMADQKNNLGCTENKQVSKASD
ncbi:hypothetical protein CHS0354_011149 [Potamilus streckersoni]|uniref:Alcohol dehydrogenase-like C-terminal domain-containing protein n=1 Tax=Potamilus streckersoni TaxID=2493646 RepID=A0AAE0VNE5_9BIVA|nr:hypothetical protein CHS0354_011149 [Potamilus streckersoni]